VKPYYQGTLDGLCAVYSIVNATRIVAGISEPESRELFHESLEYLGRNRDLPAVLTSGIGMTTISGILREVVGDRIPNRSMPFKQHPETPLDVFWGEMMAFLEGEPRRAILLGVGGPAWDHWSIVDSVTDRQVHFFDSHKLTRLNRTRCTTTRSTTRRPHVLCPTHAYFLS
jgi:hypothetical protein